MMLRLALFALACIAAIAGTWGSAAIAERCDAAAIYKSCVDGNRPNCEQLLEEQQARCDERAAEAARARAEAEERAARAEAEDNAAKAEAEERAARAEAEDNAAKAEAEERDSNRDWIDQLPSSSSRIEDVRKLLPSRSPPPQMNLPTRKKLKAGEL